MRLNRPESFLLWMHKHSRTTNHHLTLPWDVRGYWVCWALIHSIAPQCLTSYKLFISPSLTLCDFPASGTAYNTSWLVLSGNWQSGISEASLHEYANPCLLSFAPAPRNFSRPIKRRMIRELGVLSTYFKWAERSHISQSTRTTRRFHIFMFLIRFRCSALKLGDLIRVSTGF